MSRFSLNKTFLLERDPDRLQFHTESAPLVKAVLLTGVVVFFLITYSVPGTAAWIRMAIIGFCLCGFLFMGKRSRLTISREERRITLDRSFYFFRKIRRISFSDCTDVILVSAGGVGRLQLRLADGTLVPAGITGEDGEAALWRTAILALLGRG